MQLKRNSARYFLTGILLLLSIGALYGGSSMLLYPDGSQLGLPSGLLEETPFSNYRIPGFLLLVLLGLFPLLTAYGLVFRHSFRWTRALNLFPKYHWSWTFSYYTGIVLILWINMQLLLGIGFHLLHFVYDMLGLLIIIITQLPALKAGYRL